MVDDPVQEPRLVVSPSRTVVGKNAVDHVGKYATTYGNRALLITTPQIYDIHGDKVEASLDDHGVPYNLFTDVQADPTVETIEAAYDRWNETESDIIVTLGGGSSIDTGKGVGILATNEDQIRDYGVDRAGREGVPNPIPPLIAVNTTTGTGSETTRNVVITDETSSTKFPIISQNVVPEVAIEDPELTRSLPKSHTAFTGIDALTHAIEAYVSVNSFSISDTFARNAIRRINDSLRTAWSNGENIAARTETMIAQFQAGQAFTNSSVALVHGMARPLGAQLAVPHGLANAILLPYIIEFSAMSAPEKYADIARLMDSADESDADQEAAQMASEAVFDLCKDLQVVTYLDEYGDIPARKEYLGMVKEMASDAIDSGSPANNPRNPSQEEIEDLFVRVYDDALASDSPRRS